MDMRYFSPMVFTLFCCAAAGHAQPPEPAALTLDAAQLPVQEALPDPLTMLDGTRVETPEQWRTQRRPEIKRLFETYVYGVAPPPPRIEATVDQEDPGLFGGKATLRQVTISFPDLPANAPRIHLAIFAPIEESLAPVILALNKCGNYTVSDFPGVRYYEETILHDQCPPGDVRGFDKDFWAIEHLIDRGYAFATFHESDIDPDFDDFTDGIHPFFPNLPGPRETHWGTIAAWAWGLQRCVDYLITDPDIDSGGICVTGHSRRGKAALLAGAFDERIAITIPLQSGTGGMALSRNNNQETVEHINRVFPHWFNDVFAQFAEKEARLPVDQHLLTALAAPRPVLDVGGLQDRWANYESALRNLQAADPVYKLLGTPGLQGTGLVSEEEPILGPNFGTLLQYRRDTPHTINAGYWKQILDFTDAHLGR